MRLVGSTRTTEWPCRAAWIEAMMPAGVLEKTNTSTGSAWPGVAANSKASSANWERISEIQLERGLHNAGIAGTGDAAEVHILECTDRVEEVGPVEGVEDLPAKLKTALLGEGE